MDFCIVGCVSRPWQIEIEPEVRQWLELLPDAQYDKAERAADMLAAQPTTLGEPYSRHLGGKVRELRFTLDGNAVRVTYWLAPVRRIVLLTVFRKTRQHETAEVERAQQAQKVCEADHDPAEHDYDRAKEESP
ncbi:type II toxin-antitoxin system RelE/ParE family toxin [Streptomyces sp. NPDC002537]